jgi:predicted metal-dependent hydrolase
MLIEMNDFSVTVHRKKVKNINLRIKRTGEVYISVPMKTSIKTIQNFLNFKRPWIEMHRHRLHQLEQESSPQLLSEGYINFQGISYIVQLHETQAHQRIELSNDAINFYIYPGIIQSHKELLLAKWYRMQMEKIYPSMLEKWQSIMDVYVHKVSIRRMKSRWGSCHPIKKHITLNLRLIEKPSVCLEYVIVHELVHLFEANHNQHFYALMNHYLPNWRCIKKLLR